jgi:hypothetical protein
MKLLDQVRQKLRAGHYAYRTEQAYVHWNRRLILFHDKRHPREMGERMGVRPRFRRAEQGDCPEWHELKR